MSLTDSRVVGNIQRLFDDSQKNTSFQALLYRLSEISKRACMVVAPMKKNMPTIVLVCSFVVGVLT